METLLLQVSYTGIGILLEYTVISNKDQNKSWVVSFPLFLVFMKHCSLLITTCINKKCDTFLGLELGLEEWFCEQFETLKPKFGRNGSEYQKILKIS